MGRDTAMKLIDELSPPGRHADAVALLDLMTDVTGEEPKVEGKTVGFGSYHYRYPSGQEGDFARIAYTVNKQGLTIYVMSGLRGFDDLLDRLGPHRASKSTVKIKSLEEVDIRVLVELISECVRHLKDVEASLGAIPRMSEIPPRVPSEPGVKRRFRR